MKSGLLPLALLPLAALAQPAPATTPAPADPLDALAADSPFLPGTGAGRAAAASTGPLEMRSIVFVDGSYRFSIFDQGTGQSNWVGIEEKGYPFVVRSFNRERDELTVEHQGRSVVLGLQPARMASAAVAGPASPAPLPGQNQGQGLGPGDPNNPTNRRNQAQQNAGPGPAGGQAGQPASSAPNAAEAQRLQNLADEIRRRRGGGFRFNPPSANQANQSNQTGQPNPSNQRKDNRP